MARTSIDVQGVLNSSRQINAAKSTASGVRGDLDWMRGQISSTILNRNNLRERLRNVSVNISNVESRMNRIRITAENGANRFYNADRRIVTQRTQLGAKVSKKVVVQTGTFAAAEAVKQAVHKIEIKEKDIAIPTHVSNNGKILSGVDYTYDFLSGRNQILDALAAAWDSDWLKNFLSLFGVSEDLNEKAVRQSIEFLIKDTLKNKHEVSDFYEEYTTTLSPEEFKIFKEISDLIADTGKTYTDIELAEILKIDVREISESQYIQFLCQQDNVKFFKSLSNKLELTLKSYSDATEALDVASKMIGRVLNDYTEDVIYLEAIRQALIDGGYELEVVNETVDNMLWDYNNQACSAIMIGIDKICEEGTETLISKTIPVLDLFLAAKDIGCSVSGLDDATENIEMIYATQHYSYGLIEKYEYYADKIRTGDYAKEDIEQCNIYFELAKNAKIQEYKAMINVYESALEDTNVNMFSGVVDVIKACSVTEEEKKAVKTQIDILEVEIVRLKDLDGYNSTIKNVDIRAKAVVGGGSMGGR